VNYFILILFQDKYEKVLQEKEKGTNVVPITPDWVLESVKNKSRCDEDLFHPSLLILEKKEYSDPLASSLADITGFAEPETPEVKQVAAGKPNTTSVLDPHRLAL
jgi:hypothetical protein